MKQVKWIKYGENKEVLEVQMMLKVRVRVSYGVDQVKYGKWKMVMRV